MLELRRVNLPGKALRTLVELRGLPSESTCVLEAEPGELDIQRHSPSTCILFISLPIGSLFKLAIKRNYQNLCRFSVINEWRRHSKGEASS